MFNGIENFEDNNIAVHQSSDEVRDGSERSHYHKQFHVYDHSDTCR
jgi:hypothetical protein